MNSRIIYQPIGQPVSILTPCNCGITLKQIGEKDVPRGLPFWMVPAESIPTDRTFRDAWELDLAIMGEPSGVGSAE